MLPLFRRRHRKAPHLPMAAPDERAGRDWPDPLADDQRMLGFDGSVPVSEKPLVHSRHAQRGGSAAGPLLSVEEAAAVLGTPVRFVRRLVAERRIPFHRVGRYVRIRTSDLDAFIAAGRIDAMPSTRPLRR